MLYSLPSTFKDKLKDLISQLDSCCISDSDLLRPDKWSNAFCDTVNTYQSERPDLFYQFKSFNIFVQIQRSVRPKGYQVVCMNYIPKTSSSFYLHDFNSTYKSKLFQSLEDCLDLFYSTCNDVLHERLVNVLEIF